MDCASYGASPLTIFVFNSNKTLLEIKQARVGNVVDVQSIGAAIQNMLLAACELGLGTLWICDVFYAYQELVTWLGETHQMIAVVSRVSRRKPGCSRPRIGAKDA